MCRHAYYLNELQCDDCVAEAATVRKAKEVEYQIDQRVLDAIVKERQRQIDKWGRYKDMPPPVWLMVLGEEFGEACAAAHDTLYDDGNTGDEDHLDAELVQVAAVAIAWLEERKLGMSLCLPEFRHDYDEEPTDA